MKALTAADRPDRVTLDVGGSQVVFVRVAGDQYAAERGGNRLPVRTRREVIRHSETGSRRMWEPEVREGETANIDALLYCLSLSPERTSESPHGVKLVASENWGHYRQWTFLTIAVTIEPSGVVAIDEGIGEEDESYY